MAVSGPALAGIGRRQAAEVMVWSLMNRPVWIVSIPHNGCGELRSGYLALTGHQPLHGYTDECEKYDP